MEILKMMGECFSWKEFLKPSKEKILSSILLLAIVIILVWFMHFLNSSDSTRDNIISIIILLPFQGLLLLFYESFFPILIAYKFLSLSTFLLTILFSIILLSLTYVFGCYINRSKKTIKGLVLYVVAFLLIFTAIFILIEGVYNPLFGRSCNIDTDCHYNWDVGSFNLRYIRLSNPFLPHPSISHMHAICENNRCTILDEKTTSEEYCEIRDGLKKGICYLYLARNLDDPNLCDKIEDEEAKMICQNWFKKEKNER